MKVYSGDPRKKVLTAYQNRKGSMRQPAERFTVSPTSVSNLINNFRQNGHIRPKPHGGGKTPAINEEGRIFLSEITDKNPDLTLKELCGYYERETGKKVSKPAMDRTLKKMNITRKKKFFMIRKKIPTGSDSLQMGILRRLKQKILMISYLLTEQEHLRT